MHFISFFLNHHLYADSKLIIETESGISNGELHNNVITWHDIPYAKPPIGSLRWMAQEIYFSQKILDNLTDNFCVQQSSNLGGASGDTEIVGKEDCLYLDIRAPKK